MMQNNIKVAITGGIGSGKSTVAKFIAEQGFTVVSCDEIYKKLLQNQDFVIMLSSVFGDILTDDKKLDKHKLSEIVFSDSSKLQKLNSVTHPYIMCEALKQMDGNKISFCEVPLLFEGGFENLFDEIIIVLRNKNDSIRYAAKRDNLSEDEIKKRVKNQLDYKNIDLAKYYVIHNDLNFDNLNYQILKIIKEIIKQ